MLAATVTQNTTFQLPPSLKMTPARTEIDSAEERGGINDNPGLLGDSSKNPAFVLREKGAFEYATRSVPTLPSEDHVIVTVHVTGLCGSDIHYWTHGEIGDFKVTKPIILGHESSGIVQQCGSAVRTLKPGDRVALEPGAPCRTCTQCQKGKYNLCPYVQFAATPPYDGTLAKYYTLPESLCYKLPAQVSLEEGALIEPLSVAVHCAKLAQITFGTSVLVLGAGPIGLLCCAAATAFGAVNVVAVDIVQERLQFAKNYAATSTYEIQALSPEESSHQIMSTAGITEGFDVVIDATGAQACINTGVYAMRRGGTFIQAGLGAAQIQFPVAQLCFKEGVYRGSFRYGPGDYTTAIELVAQGKINLSKLVTHQYSFEDAELAFKNVGTRQGIKTIIYGPGIEGGAAIGR